MSAGSLLRAISTALANSNTEKLKIPKKYNTLGEFYREYSKYSTHELDVSKETLRSQLKPLILSNKELTKLLGNNLDNFINEAVSEFRGNILAFIQKRKTYKLLGGGIISTTGKLDNFQQVRNLVNAGFNTSNAYDISKFISDVANKLGLDTSSIKYDKKYGLDIGHAHSNVVSAYGAVIFNSIRRAKLDISSEELLEEINTLYDKMNDPSVMSELMNKSGITDEALFKACVDATVGFTKKMLGNELQVILNAEPKLDATVIRKIASSVLDRTFPEFSVHNQQKGATLERAISNHLSKATSGYFLQLFNEIAIGKHINLLTQESSKPAIKLIEENIINRLTGKPSLKVNTTTKVTPRKVKVSVSTAKRLKQNTARLNKVSVPALRNLQGQFTSVTRIESLLRARLKPTIIKNMHRPNLNYKSGRFVDSVSLESISRARDGSLTAFLSYMKYPYATFERGGKQGKKGYYPSRLIEGSVREIASTLVRDRMRVVIQ